MYKRQCKDCVSCISVSDGSKIKYNCKIYGYGACLLYTSLIPISIAVFYIFYRDSRGLSFINLSPKAGFAAACALAVLLAVFIRCV